MRVLARAFLAASLVFATACGHPKTPEEMRRSICEKHPERVALYRNGERPDRRYRVLTEVDALFFMSTASRTRTLQVKACLLDADAVIDVTETPYSVREKLAITP